MTSVSTFRSLFEGFLGKLVGYLSIFQKEIWHVRAVELWSRLGSGRCAGWDELKGGEFFSEDRFARVKPRLDFCQDIAEREMVQPF